MPWLAGPRLRGKGIKRGTKQDDIKWYYYRRGISAPLWHHKDLVFQECWVLTHHSRLFYLCIGIRRILNTIWDLQVKGRYTDRHKQGTSLEMTSITQLKSAGHRETSHNYLSVQPHRSPILLSRFISLDTTRQTSDRKWKSAWSWCRGRHHLPGTPFDRLAALRVRASITGVKIDCPLFLKNISIVAQIQRVGESQMWSGWAAAGSEVMQSRRKEGLVKVLFFANILIFQYSSIFGTPSLPEYWRVFRTLVLAFRSGQFQVARNLFLATRAAVFLFSSHICMLAMLEVRRSAKPQLRRSVGA